MVAPRALRVSARKGRGPTAEPSPAAPAPAVCPLCGRPLVPGPSVDAHHPVPRSRGGKAKVPMHRICHRKIHATFTERELADDYHDWDRLRAHPDIAAFVRWVAKRPPEYLDRSISSRRLGRR